MKAPTLPTILIIEDDSFISTFLEAALKEKYHVLVSTTATDAQKTMVQEKVDLILLDILLPDQDGFELLTKLKQEEHLKHIPVIILSNLGQPEHIERGLKLGAIDYLVKANQSPAEIAVLVEKVLGQNTK